MPIAAFRSLVEAPAVVPPPAAIVWYLPGEAIPANPGLRAGRVKEIGKIEGTDIR